MPKIPNKPSVRPATPTPRSSVPVPQLSPYRDFCERWKEGCGAEECGRAKQVVQARGSIPCDVLFVGEAPGDSEDAIGRPFVGPAGKVLDQIIEQSIPEYVRWAICNTVGCMPTEEDGLKAGEPTYEQIMRCTTRLVELVALADPKLIVCVGTTSRDHLSPQYKHSPRFHKEIPQVAIVHPAAMLRSNIATRGFLVQQAIVKVSNAVQEMVERNKG